MNVACLIMAFLLIWPFSRSPSTKTEFEEARMEMVKIQIQRRGVRDKRTLEAMRKTPRHLFVPEDVADIAYTDRPLPIGYGQTISQPYMVAYMTEVLELTGKEKVLEIGTGSGYQAAVLAETAKEVYSVEIIPELHEQVKKRLAKLGYGDVKLKLGDGYFGWSENAPYDRIIVTCAAGHLPLPLIKQLKPGGMMVIPVGMPWTIQTLVLVLKDKKGDTVTRSLMSVGFVPLVRSGPD